MRRVISRALLAIALGASASVAAQAATPASESDRAVMADYLIDMMPLHTIFAQLMKSNDGELKGQLDDAQLECFQQQVSRPALLARKRREVDAFAEQDPANFAASLTLLRDGAGETVKRLGQASVGAALQHDGETDADQAIAQAAASTFDVSKMEPDQLIAFMSFAYGSPYRRLRELSGYGEFTDAGSEAASPVETMLDAMAIEIAGTCGIPAEFFE